MIDGSEKRNRQLAFELQNSHVCEQRSNGDLQKNLQRQCGMMEVKRFFLFGRMMEVKGFF